MAPLRPHRPRARAATVGGCTCRHCLQRAARGVVTQACAACSFSTGPLLLCHLQLHVPVRATTGAVRMALRAGVLQARVSVSARCLCGRTPLLWLPPAHACAAPRHPLAAGTAAVTLRMTSWASACWMWCCSRETRCTCRAGQVRCVMVVLSTWSAAALAPSAVRLAAPLAWGRMPALRARWLSCRPLRLPGSRCACSAPGRVASRQPLPAPHHLRQPAALVGG